MDLLGNDDAATAERLDNRIALILDAKACNKRHEDLKAAEADLRAVVAENTQILDSTKAEREAIDAAVADNTRLIEEVSVSRKQCHTEQTVLQQRIAAVVVREANVEQREADAKQKLQKAGEQENAAYHAKLAADDREEQAAEAIRQANTVKADYEARIKRLVATAAGSELAEAL